MLALVSSLFYSAVFQPHMYKSCFYLSPLILMLIYASAFLSWLCLLYDLLLSRKVGRCLLHSYEEYFSYLQQNYPGDFFLDCTFCMVLSITWV